MVGAAAGTAASQVKPGTPALERATAHNPVGAIHSAQPGSTGESTVSSSSRMTQTNLQKAAVSGTMQATKRSEIKEGQTSRNVEQISAQKSAPDAKDGPTVSSAAKGPQPQLRTTDTRYSQRPVRPVPKGGNSQRGTSDVCQTAVHTENSQHGPAGTPTTAPAQKTARVSQPGRNGSSPIAAVSTETRRHDPTRQEPHRKPASAMTTVKETAPIPALIQSFFQLNDLF